jgi:hypothetical protein
VKNALLSKISKMHLEEDRQIKKSVKELFATLEFNMANNEVSENGAATQEDLKRKHRILEITQKEQQRY